MAKLITILFLFGGVFLSHGSAEPVTDEKAGATAVASDQSTSQTTSTEAALASASQFKEPPPEKPSDARRRSWVILSFWVIVLCLGLPIWWNTTTIYRANLPLSQMLEWSDGKASWRESH